MGVCVPNQGFQMEFDALSGQTMNLAARAAGSS